jgi:hypothetical protein
MTASPTNYIVFYEDAPKASLFLAAHSPLNAARDFAHSPLNAAKYFLLQRKSDAKEPIIIVREEANLHKTHKFQNIGGSWKEIPASDGHTTLAATSAPLASSATGGNRMVAIRRVSIGYAALYGGVGYALASLVGALFVAITISAASASHLFAAFIPAVLIGTLSGALGALFYNVISAVTGGLRVELADDDNPL